MDRTNNSWQPAIVSLVLACLLAPVFLSGCGGKGPAAPNELVVSAAVSLKDAFNEVARIHEERTGMKIRFNFGASGALQKQIESGAPVDIFASAGEKQMDELAGKNLIVPGSRKDFARNVLVLIEPASGASLSSFAELAKLEVRKIAVGNPRTVPAGQYTQQTFTRLKLVPDLQSKLVYAEDVRQVLDYVVRGEVDAGVVYLSDALTGGSHIKTVARAPDDAHDPILYPIAVVKESPQADAARSFIDLVLSPEGQNILTKYGFVAVK